MMYIEEEQKSILTRCKTKLYIQAFKLKRQLIILAVISTLTACNQASKTS